jgi:hypothetical protein
MPTVSPRRFIFRQTAALTQLIQLYVSRCYHVWKDSDLMHWLEKNVHVVLDRVDKNDPIAKDYEMKRSKRYQGPLPRSIARHILLSDIKDLTPITDVILHIFVIYYGASVGYFRTSVGLFWALIRCHQKILSTFTPNQNDQRLRLTVPFL